jgi:c-di-GMP-related signal transduction protein
MEAIEQFLFQEPVLVYRYLIYANSAGLGLRTEVSSVWQGLMVMGLTALREWLASQLSFANHDVNLNPLRFELLARAKLMANLLDSGQEDELRREVYLCGLFSNIQGLLGEPLSQALGRLPLPQRVLEALLHQTGPYAPYLRIVNSISDDKDRETLALCNLYQISVEEVNRSLLRTLLS